mmetsp:Transcript_15702/g.29617  ORF Transcript_15702/g.29617 Transcript_15702/m.29617 type:complete len:635 (+) Transcript_15702:82-1986(+)
MISSLSLRTVARRGVAVSLGTTSVGVAAVTAYAYTEQGAGFRREVQFWSKVFPIVADYYFKTAQSSPWVKFQKWSRNGIYNFDKSQDDQQDEVLKQRQRKLLNSLHDEHAPEILQVMLDLKGLYIKLGQVLSVTVLPVPEQYRKLFRTLQSDVPGHEEFESVVKPTIERELGKPLEDIFEFVDPVPCGAASIGQAHRAKLKVVSDGGDSTTKMLQDDKDRMVIIKVQYPDAVWKIPADIQCVGDFLKICVWAGVVDEESSQLSFDEFSRQFLSELDYNRERQNCQTIYESSLDPKAPYAKNNIVVPKIHEDLCTQKIITMSYIPGVSMEAEAKRQLEMLGIDTSGGISQIIKDAAQEATRHPDDVDAGSLVRRMTKSSEQKQKKRLFSFKVNVSKLVGSFIGLDSALWAVRIAKRILLSYQALLVSSIQKLPFFLVNPSWKVWAEKHSMAAEQGKRLGEIDAWCIALFDVHGHQIFNLGLFNADCHPGNILLSEDDTGRTKIGLIDYGQCKKLTPEEQYKVARLVWSIANDENDEVIAQAFRDMNIITQNDSTEFLAKFGKLMFGTLEPEHLQHSWHMNLHKQDKVLYFPKELSMVYRTSLLLRGLAISLQMNYSVGEQWKHHAKEAMERIQIG